MKLSKILSAGTAAVLAIALSGCSMKFGTNTEPKDDLVVAEPQNGGDDDMKIAYKDFKKEYNYSLKRSGIEDDREESIAETCKTERQSIITYLINERIIMKKAAERGISELSEEEMNAVEKSYNAQIEEQIAAFAEDADFGTAESTDITDEKRREQGEKDFDAFLEDCGLTRDDLLSWEVSSAITQKLIDDVTKDLEYSDAEEAFGNYEEQVKQLYSDDIAQYEQSFTSVWLPEGARMVKHILIGFDSDTITEITEARKGDDNAAADKLRKEKAAELQDKVDEVQKKLDDGADFQALITEYSADAESSSANPDGYIMIPNGTRYVDEFQKAAFELEKIGDRKVCVSDYGVHIVLYAADAKVSDEQKKSFTDYLYDQLKNNAFGKQINEWKTEYNYKIAYEALRLDDPAESSSN